MFLNSFFSTGRIIFIIFFVIAFIMLMVYSYRKDKKNHTIYYKGAARKVAIYGGFIIVVYLVFKILVTS